MSTNAKTTTTSAAAAKAAKASTPATAPNRAAGGRKAPAKAAPPAPAKTARRTPAPAPAPKAVAETRKCEGACGLVLPITKFPTIGRRDEQGVMLRGKECRGCRDARRDARQAAAAK